MGRKCTSGPTITAVIRNLKATTQAADAETLMLGKRAWRMQKRSLVGIVVVTILLCQFGGSHCYAVGGGVVGGSGSDPLDQPFIVDATNDDRDPTNVLINEVDSAQRTCDR